MNSLASKTIDILTSQNVVITYDLATVGNRFISNGLDLGLVYLLNLLRHSIGLGSGISESFFAECIILVWLYHLLIVIFFNGRSVGMRVTGIHVLKPGGGNVEFADLFLRWIVRPLDITFTVCALGVFLMLGSEKRQRLGDMLAGTAVVRNKHQIHFSLSDILAFHEKSDVQSVKYPAVKHLAEQDMLMVKNLLNNEAGYSLQVHRDLLYECRERMAELLGLTDTDEDPQYFLQSLVNDYIVLTR